MEDRLDKFEVILCKTADDAREINPDITIEAEYGKDCVEGKELTLAHHGPRSDNPAPCDTQTPVFEGGRIAISHIDLDTIGGILSVAGEKPEDPAFWSAAAYMDVAGYHHVHELEPEIQDKLNGYNAWNHHMREERAESDRDEPKSDVTSQIKESRDALRAVLDREHPDHDRLIQDGRDWARELEKETESRCVFENQNVRAFVTDGVPCSAAYYSPTQGEYCPATVVFNQKYDSISVAFYDGGSKDCSAREIVQGLWGEGAGGRDGIAGSPRGEHMTMEQFREAIDKVQDVLIERKGREEQERADSRSEKEEPQR